MAASAAAKKVCVTGAGGFVASWLVKVLLSKGYIVHGTVRQPGSQKYEHLLKLERASENLKLFKADLLSYESVHSAIVGCSAVFHVASPVPSTIVPNPEVEVIEPAVKGTANVLEACLKAKVERVVFVSSIAAIGMNPNFSKDKVLDESCWSDKEYCRKSSDSLENKHRWIVDVRDLVDALLLAYEKHEAEGRYICTSFPIKTQDLVEKLKSIYPNYNYPTNFIEVDDYRVLSSEKLQRLGWKYRPLEETLIDSVESYREAGLLQSE
ncbi:cinnamoyl-CoA reductase 2-like isoform X2 [Gastrolobium bilobum]|uniref:cinnamoyl-CoA reductase 2-like isoform X2 n=1 Tax=Gastrolobium bilobum TaxID=150636 RepID=UPI002AB019CE|nr:cinnamoyl-CoA reductase 2-like isoform X2 [Gastrolobium bilobum]